MVYDAIPFLARTLGVSWVLAILSIVAGMVIAVPLAVGRMYGPIGVKQLCIAIIEVVRGIPDLLIIFWAYMALPIFFNFNVSSWWAAVIALTALASVNLAEVIRGGVYSVSNEQIQAGKATGLGGAQIFMYIVLPQAIRNMIPAMAGQLVSIFKTTSLVYVIGMVEFFRAVTLVNSSVVAPYPLYLTMAVVYFICCFTISFGVRLLDPDYIVVD
ncbi:amino acid ABC transporter permease [Hoeflea sp. G2-23]|uniref:Amino acid ABC transporter permease n=1 Tax=Hoeflea algicola TaxID=2983763 RepID=A0ABT3ZAZ5_9HYPH|nr:amino acid ABC transporter permease [Hoeflea algicola]MCY0148504.1 amino acid ABC transporter permease [Hoeflea algicola]